VAELGARGERGELEDQERLGVPVVLDAVPLTAPHHQRFVGGQPPANRRAPLGAAARAS